jgi:hypothetical protein
MPNPRFEPIIGSSFDAIAGQRAGWSRFNADIENQNLARAVAAQEAQNRWSAQVAQMQAQDAARADQANRFQTELTVGQQNRVQDQAESGRRFDISAQLDRDRTATEGKRFDYSIKERNRLEAKALDEAESYAKAKVPELNRAAKDFEAAQKARDSVLDSYKRSIAAAQVGIPGVVFNGKFLVPTKTFNESADRKKLDDANETIGRLEDAAASAAAEHKSAETELNRIRRESEGLGLSPTRLASGRWGFWSLAHKKSFGGEMPEPETQAAPDSFVPARFSQGDTDVLQSIRNPTPWQTPGSRFDAPDIGPVPGVEIQWGRDANGIPVPLTNAAPAPAVSSIEASRNARFDVAGPAVRWGQ